jgi:hypothetical protein
MFDSIMTPQSPAASDAQLPLAAGLPLNRRGGCNAPAVEKLWLCHCVSHENAAELLPKRRARQHDKHQKFVNHIAHHLWIFR